MSGEDFGWRVRVQRLQIVRQQAEAFCQRRRDFHEIQSPIKKDRSKVLRAAQVPWASSFPRLFVAAHSESPRSVGRILGKVAIVVGGAVRPPNGSAFT